jgi:uncharacterized protein
MRVEGSFAVAAPRAEVWLKITDPALMASCIPGCEEIEHLSPTRYRAKVTVAVGPIKASFNLVVDVTSEEPPERVLSTTRGEEGTQASIVSAENVLSLADLIDGGTQISYESEVSVTGRLGKFGLGVMKKKAEALGNQFAASFRAKVETSLAQEAG